jgi:hypothetical protein
LQKLLAPNTSGPRDVPRRGALSLLQKTLQYRGDPAETAAGLNAKLWVLVDRCGRELPLFSPILFSNPFEPSRTILNLRLKSPSREL